MNKRLPKFIVLLVFIISLKVSAGIDLQLGARPQGMGGAFIALANDANAVYWNPAGLCQLTNGEVTFMHWSFAEISQIMVDYLSFAYPVNKGALGFSWIRQGAELEEGPLNTTSTMSENNFMLSYGMMISPRFSVGLSLNRLVINSKIGNGAGIGFEFGGLYKVIENGKWTIDFVAINVASNMKNESLLPYYIAGTALKFSFSEQ